MKAATEKAAAPRKKKTNGNGHSKSVDVGVSTRPVPTPRRNEVEVSRVELDQTVVARRAWEIWKSEGCPTGRELDHWLQAEREIIDLISA